MFLVLWLNVDSETVFEHDCGLLLSLLPPLRSCG
jgi:hypothetical protein